MITEHMKEYTLVERLLDQTRLGKLAWQETNREGVYQATFTNYSVRLAPYVDSILAAFGAWSEVEQQAARERGEDIYVLTISNADGHVTDRIGPPHSLSILGTLEMNSNPTFALTLNALKKLYETVDSKFNKSSALDELLGELS